MDRRRRRSIELLAAEETEDRAQRNSLKKIAEGLKSEVISVDEYLAETGQADRSVH